MIFYLLTHYELTEKIDRNFNCLQITKQNKYVMGMIFLNEKLSNLNK